MNQLLDAISREGTLVSVSIRYWRAAKKLEAADLGLEDRQIADRLVVSVRSVEGHLYRACQRVGASTREELAAILRAGPKALG